MNNDTTIRVDVAATGKLVAAALVYSAHTKALRPVVIQDRWDELLKEDDEVRFLKTHFENPDSPYFLNALSPRSNISSGGGLIPLMGPTFGKFLHPVLGLDFLPDGSVRQKWLIDANPGPGVQAYTRCWPEQGADLRRNVVRQRLAALATIAPLYKQWTRGGATW